MDFTGLTLSFFFRATFLLEVLKNNSFSCFLQLLEITCATWLVYTLLHVQSQQFSVAFLRSFSHHHISLWPQPGKETPAFKDLCNYIRSTCIVQDNFLPRSTILFISAKFSLHFYRFLGLGYERLEIYYSIRAF